MDWAEACHILGVPQSATDQDIKEQYIYKAQLLHPDKNQDKPENIRRRAEAELVLVNQAYAFVSNANNNPYKIPPKLAIEPAAIRFKDVNIGEKKSTTLTIRNVGGPYTSIWIDNQPAPWVAVTGVKSITNERLPLEVALECTGMGEPETQYTCDLAIKLENENTKAVDNAAINIELVTAHKSPEPGTKKEVISPSKRPRYEAPREVAQTVSRMGFSPKAFLANLLAFAILGAMAFFGINYFLKLDQMTIAIGSIIYGSIAVGICVNHGINVGSRHEKDPT
jgi:hypothetical protein